MDPEATLSELCDAILDEDWQQASILSEAFANWTRKGGWLPQATSDGNPKRQWSSLFEKLDNHFRRLDSFGEF